MPDTDAEDFGDDGVAVDRRLAGGAVDYATVLAEMRAIDDEEAGAEGTSRRFRPSRLEEKKKGVFGGSERDALAGSTDRRGGSGRSSPSLHNRLDDGVSVPARRNARM